MLFDTVPALKNIVKLSSRFGWLVIPSHVMLWITLILFLTFVFSYADDHKAEDKQSQILLNYAEKIVANDLTSEYSLKMTRSRLVEMRGYLLEREKVHLNKVKNLTDQIEAMDSPILDDEIMSDQLRELRESLKSDLARESFPLAFSRSARERAEQAIDKIDSLLLEKFKSKLLSKSSSPLYLFSWNSTISELSVIGQEIVGQASESVSNLGNSTTGEIMVSLFFLALGFVFFWLRKFFNKEMEDRADSMNTKKWECCYLLNIVD